MESLQTAISMIVPGLWLVSVDLQDAYFHVPIYREYRKYLRFILEDVVYEFCDTSG